jgi:hypothetical protein
MARRSYGEHMTSTLPTTDQLLDLAAAVADDGVAAHRPAVAEVVAWARRRSLRPVLLEVLEDPTVPDAVHQRALGRLIVAIFRAGGDDGQRPGDPVGPPSSARVLTAA